SNPASFLGQTSEPWRRPGSEKETVGLVPVAAVPLVTAVTPFALGLMKMAVAALVPMRRVPLSVRMGRPGPPSADPGIMSGSAVPVAANPHEIRPGADPDDHFLARRGRRPLDIDAYRDVRQGRGGRGSRGGESREGEEAEARAPPNRGAGSAEQMVQGLFH